MASIAKRGDGSWRARYRDRFGTEHSKHFRRKVDAQRWLDEVTTSIETGTWVDPQRARVTVGDMATLWLASNPDWEESTRERARGIVENYIRPRWGSVRLADVEHEDLQAWVGGIDRAGGTVRKIGGTMSGILALAVAAKRMPSNPMQGVKLPKQQLARRRYLTVGEVEALATAGDRGVVLTLAYTGLRIGELAALTVGCVDLGRRRLRVERSVTEVNGRLVWTSPKDHQRRSVPYPDFMAPLLKALVKDRGPDELAFASPRGEALRVRNMRRSWFDAAAKSAGVAGLTPHELRHTAASLAVSAGASVLALQRMLGHEKASITLDTYADLFDEDLDTVADRLSISRADFLRTSGVRELPANRANRL